MSTAHTVIYSVSVAVFPYVAAWHVVACHAARSRSGAL